MKFNKDQIITSVIAALITATIFYLITYFKFGYNQFATRLIPDDAILLINDEECPDGWEDYKKGYGRFIRGIDRNEKKIDPAGERLASSHQEDSLIEHKHFAFGHANSHVQEGDSRDYIHRGQRDLNTGRIAGNINVSTETRPKNVALLLCKKK